MPWIAHRRRGSKFGRHPVKFLVPFRLLPLALSTSSLRHPLALTLPLLSKRTEAFDPTETSPAGHTFVSRSRLLSSFLQPAAATMLTAGSLCL